MPLVSVVIPNFNHAVFLRKRIDSVLNQTFQDFEIIILDDASTDDSRAVIESYRNHSKVIEIAYNTENSGSPFSQWSKGIEKSKCEWLWIAESDDFAEPEFLEELIRNANTNPNVGISFCNSNWLFKNGELGASCSIYETSFFKLGLEEILTLLKRNTIQNASSSIIRTEHAKLAMKSIEKFRWCGDWLLYLTVLRKSNICYTNKCLNNFRWYDNNSSQNAGSMGSWTIEGMQLLYEFSRDPFKVRLPYLNRLIWFWANRVSKSPGITFIKKIRMSFVLMKIYLRLLAQ